MRNPGLTIREASNALGITEIYLQNWLRHSREEVPRNADLSSTGLSGVRKLRIQTWVVEQYIKALICNKHVAGELAGKWLDPLLTQSRDEVPSR